LRGDGGISSTEILVRSLPIHQSIAIYAPAGLSGYDDKLRRAIGTADPGAVPGGSTMILAQAGLLMGPN